MFINGTEIVSVPSKITLISGDIDALQKA